MIDLKCPFQVSPHVGIQRSFPERPTRGCVRWPVLEPGIPHVWASLWPVLVRKATITVLRSTRRSTALGRYGHCFRD